MRWDRFFEDLEDQLDSEWEAERAALDTEAERLRLSRVALRERLVALARGSRGIALHEPGAPRRAENVTGYRIVPFTGVLAVRLASASDLG